MHVGAPETQQHPKSHEKCCFHNMFPLMNHFKALTIHNYLFYIYATHPETQQHSFSENRHWGLTCQSDKQRFSPMSRMSRGDIDKTFNKGCVYAWFFSKVETATIKYIVATVDVVACSACCKASWEGVQTTGSLTFGPHRSFATVAIFWTC